MAIIRYEGQPLNIVVGFNSNPLTPYGKDYPDITDVSMTFKQDLANDTDSLYLEKKESISSGVVVDSVNHKFTMVIGTGDYTNLSAGQTYFITLAVEVSGISDYVELDIPDRSVKIVSDTSRA